MTCAEDIYRLVLEELANDGNEKAKLALKMAERFATEPIDNSVPIDRLKDALKHLQLALESNGLEWCRSTDGYIQDAQTEIVEALTEIK